MHIFPTKFCDVCVPGQWRHFGHFSIQKVVISGFLAFFVLSKHCWSWSPGILTKLFFQVPGLKYAQQGQNCDLVTFFQIAWISVGIFFWNWSWDLILDPETSKLHFFLTILHIDKHITRVDFSEVDFIVKLDGNVLEAVNLWYRDRVRGVMKT